MGYRSLRECVDDLDRHGHLVRIDSPVDARLEAAAIHRRVHAAGGPAVYFANVTGCRFPMVSNLFGTMDRVRLMFRDSLAAVERLVAMQRDPTITIADYLSAQAVVLRLIDPGGLGRFRVLIMAKDASTVPPLLGLQATDGPVF